MAEIDFPSKLNFLFGPARYKCLFGGRGSGKCLAVGTRVVMADGSLRPVESVMIAEQVMGPDGKPRTVLSTTRGTGQLYRVKQTSAMDYVVNDQHILALKKSGSCALDRGQLMPSGNYRRPDGRYPSWPDFTNMRVTDVIAQSARWKEHFRGYRTGLIQFAAQPVEIDPYILGIWLGDGTGREMRVTTADPEVFQALDEYAKSFGGYASVNGKTDNKARDIGLIARSGRSNVIWDKFLAYGLKSNKHIPEAYFRNDERTRLELLAGLVDSDGWRDNGAGVYHINQTDRRLADDIKRLADHLGFRTSMIPRRSVCGNNGKESQTYTVTISGDAWRIPCRVARKQIGREDVRPNKDHLLSQITIEDAGIGEYAGFALDGDHLFLLEDGTVTHNSWGIARALLIMAWKRPMRILCARELQRSIADSVHRLLADQIEALGLSASYEIQNNSIRGRNGSEFIFAGLRHNVNSIKSMEGIDVVWVSEAAKVTRGSMEILIPTIRKEGSEIWLDLNPELEEDFVYRSFVLNPPPGAKVVRMGWEDNPFFPDVLRDEMEHSRAMDPDGFLHIWQGHTRQTVEGAIYAAELRQATEDGRITRVPYDPVKPVHTFWDLGHSDNTSIWFVQVIGFEWRVIDFLQDRLKGLDHYLKLLQAKPYVYDTDWLPHDAVAKTLASPMSIEQQARAKGRRVRIVPNIGVAHGINALRTVFPKLWFDETRCSDGLAALRRYRYDVDDGGNFSRAPCHDENSHCADALRYMSVALTDTKRADPAKATMRIALPEMGDAAWMGG